MAYVRTVKNHKSVTCSFRTNFYFALWPRSAEGVPKDMKNDHILVFLTVSVDFFMILGKLRSGLY